MQREFGDPILPLSLTGVVACRMSLAASIEPWWSLKHFDEHRNDVNPMPWPFQSHLSTF